MMMRYLHISDIHFDPKDDGRSTNELRRQLPIYLENNIKNVDYIFITGDYRNSAKQASHTRSEQENDAKQVVQYINSIATAVSVTDAAQIFIIPGNHDLDRDYVNTEKIRQIRNVYDASKGNFDSTDLRLLANRFGYFKLVYKELYGIECAEELIYNLHWYKCIGDLCILSMNSVITSNDNDESGRLVVGNERLAKLLAEIDRNKNVKGIIVLSHHSIQLFDSNEQKAIETLLKKHSVILYLCGDEHKEYCRTINSIIEVTIGCMRDVTGVEAVFSIGEIDNGVITSLTAHKWNPTHHEPHWEPYNDFDKDVQKLLETPYKNFPVNNFPFLKNTFFTGRDALLENIKVQFEFESAVSLTQTITGLGGIGKTQTALEYAYRYSYKYDVIWWIVAETPNTIMKSITNFVVTQKLAKYYDEDRVIIHQFITWFQSHHKWLLILDNVEDYKMLDTYLPKGSSNHFLFTSRLIQGLTGKKIDIDVFTLEEAVSFSCNRSNNPDEGGARELSVRLGFFPLALEQAAAYIAETPGMTYDKYIELLDKHGLEVFEQNIPITDYKLSVSKTLIITIKRIHNKAAIQLLNICAYLAPEAIDIALFSSNQTHLPQYLRQALQNQLDIDELLREITKYSLVKCKDNQLSIHRLVQEVIIGQHKTTKWLKICINLIESMISFDGIKVLSKTNFHLALPHIDAVSNHIIRQSKNTSNMMRIAEVWYLSGKGLLTMGDPKRASEHFNKAIVFYQDIKPNSIELANVFHNLGYSYKRDGKNEQAITYYNQALKIKNEVLGKYHPDTAATLNNIAIVYKNMNNFEEARKITQETIDIKIESLGKNHRDTLKAFSNLANINKNFEGGVILALKEHKRVMRIRERELGSDTDTAASYGNIGLIFMENGKPRYALNWFFKALKIEEIIYGTTQTQTAMTYFNIGNSYFYMNKLVDAKLWLDKAYEIQKDKYGSDHSETRATRNALKQIDTDITEG